MTPLAASGHGAGRCAGWRCGGPRWRGWRSWSSSLYWHCWRPWPRPTTRSPPTGPPYAQPRPRPLGAAEGFAGTDDNRHFYLRPRILSLGYSYISSMPLSSAAQPVFEQVSDQLLESCWIGALEGHQVVCVAHANATRMMSVDIRVGGRYAGFCTSMGHLLLSNFAGRARGSYCTTRVYSSYRPHGV